jgi:valyl-tRNA synthetase
MRMALCASATQAREIDLDRRRFEEFKNFANKMWNGARFVFMNLEGDDPLTNEQLSQGLDEKILCLEDRWILSKLNHTVKNVNSHLANYMFDQAAQEAYDFFWKEFCAYYVEIAKPKLFGKCGTAAERKNVQRLLVIVLTQAIRLIHPMAPFITEELFQLLKTRFNTLSASGQIDPYTRELITALQSPACIKAPYPAVVREQDLDPEIETSFDLIEKVVYTIRNIRGEMKLSPGVATDVHLIGKKDDPDFIAIKKSYHLIGALIKTNKIEMHEKEPVIGFASTGILNGFKISIPLPEELLKQEKGRLLKEQERLLSLIEKGRLQLSNDDFVNNAPKQLVEKHKSQLSQHEHELHEISSKLSIL